MREGWRKGGWRERGKEGRWRISFSDAISHFITPWGNKLFPNFCGGTIFPFFWNYFMVNITIFFLWTSSSVNFLYDNSKWKDKNRYLQPQVCEYWFFYHTYSCSEDTFAKLYVSPCIPRRTAITLLDSNNESLSFLFYF